jgi:hypothetical protein
VAAGVQNHLFAHGEQRKGYFYARFEFEQGEGDNHIVVIKMGRIKKKSAVARTKSRAGGKFQSAMALLQKELMKMACCNVSEDWEDLSGEDIECENEDNIECETLDDIECDQSNECNVTAVLNEALQWNSAAVVAILRGDSARSIRRHKQKAVQLKQSAGKQGTIYKYLIPCPVQQEVLEERQGVLEEPIAAQQLLEIEQANVADLHIDLQIYGEDDLAADEGEHMEGKLTMQEAVEELSLSDARFTNNGRDEKAVKGTRRFAFIENYIEMVWGFVKARLRKRCKFSFKDLEDALPQEIENVPAAFHRRAVQHCFRYMDAYRKGLTGPLLEYAVKKYRSHRTIPEMEPAEGELTLAQEYEMQRQQKLEKKVFW